MLDYKIYLGGTFTESMDELQVINPCSGRTIGKTYSGTQNQLEKAINMAKGVEEAMAELPSYERYETLMSIAQGIHSQKDKMAELIAMEAGKPLKYTKVEVDRCIQTFTVAAEESKRLPKEYLSLDWTPAGENREGIVNYFPIGTVAGITPFNFPLNLVAHKIAPAIAAGCPIIIKPDERTPLVALELASIIHETDLPKGGLSVIPASREVGNTLVTHNDINMLSFTGSPKAGWKMKEDCGKKKVALELGGNAGVIVCEDSDPDLAIDRCVFGGFVYSGQVCIHAQRILIQETIYDEFVRRFVEKVEQLHPGDPLDPHTEISNLIDQSNADRIESWVKEAQEQGAQVLTGGNKHGTFFEPTVLSNTHSKMKVNCEEIFGPVVTLEPFSSLGEAVEEVNNSRYGLQAGVFTTSQPIIDFAFRHLKVGGVIMNNVPAYRVDHMPYGGIKDSGLGREGLKYAIREMMEPRLLVKPVV